MLAESRVTVDNTEHWRRFFADETGALDRALEASVQPYIDYMRLSLLEGYTTGEYVTGQASASVYATQVRDEANGSISIGVTSDLDYVWYWEFGFHHAGNGQYYRVPKWAPAMEAMRPEIDRTFVETLRSEMYFS